MLLFTVKQAFGENLIGPYSRPFPTWSLLRFFCFYFIFVYFFGFLKRSADGSWINICITRSRDFHAAVVMCLSLLATHPFLCHVLFSASISFFSLRQFFLKPQENSTTATPSHSNIYIHILNCAE